MARKAKTRMAAIIKLSRISKIPAMQNPRETKTHRNNDSLLLSIKIKFQYNY